MDRRCLICKSCTSFKNRWDGRKAGWQSKQDTSGIEHWPSIERIAIPSKAYNPRSIWKVKIYMTGRKQVLWWSIQLRIQQAPTSLDCRHMTGIMNEWKYERTNEWMEGWKDWWMDGWLGGWVDGWMGAHVWEGTQKLCEGVLTAGLMKNQIVWDYKHLLWQLHLENDGTMILQKVGNYRYAPHNDVSVNDGPHIRRWSHIII